MADVRALIGGVAQDFAGGARRVGFAERLELLVALERVADEPSMSSSSSSRWAAASHASRLE